MAAPDEVYSMLPWQGPHEIGVGHALITMVEPAVGHERAYNRWYEDDHYFSGALYMPWLFSGRRYVAPVELQNLRYPAESTLAQPLHAGCYLGAYWITRGRLPHFKRWALAANNRLNEEGRIFHERTHIFTAYQDAAGTVYRDDEVPRDYFALVDPFPGLVLEVVDAPSAAERPELERWLLTEHLPPVVTAPGSPVAMAMVFQTSGPDPDMRDEVRQMILKVGADGRRLTVLWFLDADPREVWDEVFVPEGERIAAGGRGAVDLVAPFLPAKMGTNRYDDQLRRA